MMVMNVIDAEGIPDDLIITREQEFSPLPEHIGDHHQNDVILLVVDCGNQLFKFVLEGLKFIFRSNNLTEGWFFACGFHK